MNEKISLILILAQMAELEANLRTAVHEQESSIFLQKLQDYRVALGPKK